MDVTAKISLGDPLEPARKATAQMLQERERTFSLPQPFYSDERLFDIDMQEIFQKEWLIAGMTCEIPTKGNFLTLQIGDNPVIVLRGAEGRKVAVAGGEITLALGSAAVQTIERNWKERLLAAIADPNVALILMMLGVYGLLFEFYTPGFGVSGIIGSICLLLAL